MTHRVSVDGRDGTPTDAGSSESGHRIVADGGREPDEAEGEADRETAQEGNGSGDGDESRGEDESNVDVVEAGEAEPAEPTWEKPDLDDIPEVDGPKTRPAESDGARDRSDAQTGSDREHEGHAAQASNSGGQTSDPTAGMPNTARSPGQSRLKEGGVEGYIVSLELAARLPEDLRLPEEAEDLVPVAFEAELEQDVQSFAADEFDNPSPHVETLDFVEVDDELWLRLRLGIDHESFADLDPGEIQDHALQQVDRLM